MKIIKIYLVVVTVLLLVGLGFGVYVWYTLQTLSIDTEEALIVSKEKSAPRDSIQTTEKMQSEAAADQIVVKTKDLSAAQEQILKSFGTGGETIAITSIMISCSENAVGKTRLQEILDGGAPTPIESIKLLSCFKS